MEVVIHFVQTKLVAALRTIKLQTAQSTPLEGIRHASVMRKALVNLIIRGDVTAITALLVTIVVETVPVSLALTYYQKVP